MTGEARMRWGIKIPLRDGVNLSASLYLAGADADPAPCLFALTPYNVHSSHARAMYFAKHGYAFLIVDVRGRGNSEGTFRPMIQEGADGFDIVEWIARQPFCNGKVAMFSASYEGYVQWVTAREGPPHLATIVPVASCAPGIDIPMRNNIASAYTMRWLTLVSGRTTQEQVFEDAEFWRRQFRTWFRSGRSFSELDDIVGNSSSIFQEWLKHPLQDAYWDAFRLKSKDYARLNLPILTITGCYDADQPGALHFYREHIRYASPAAVSRHFLVIGPWDHFILRQRQEFGGITVGASGMIDVLDLHCEWYGWVFGRGPKPSFLRKRVAYYVMGSDRWRYTDTLDGVTSEMRPLYLESQGHAHSIFASGTLGDAMGEGPPDTYVYDPRDFGVADLELALEQSLPLALLRPTFPTDSLLDQMAIFGQEGRVLVYHSAPFQLDTEISGFFRLRLWLAIDQSDTDFMATVYELSQGGRSILLTSDMLRARYREGLYKSKLIETNDPLCYDFEHFTFISRLVLRGSRLRLVVGPVDSIYFQRNHNSGGVVADESAEDAKAVTVRLYHDSLHPSALYVPVGQMPEATG